MTIITHELNRKFDKNSMKILKSRNFQSLVNLGVTARSRSGLSLQTSGDRKGPWMQRAIPQMVFQLLT